MHQKIGFNWQKFLDGACGKYSLVHALLILGIPIAKEKAKEVTNLSPILTALVGINEKKIKDAIMSYKCKPIEYQTDNKYKFRKKLNELLKQGCPVIVSFQNDKHWAVICGRRGRYIYYYIDSANKKLVSFYKWDSLIKDIDNDSYYLIGLKPSRSIKLKHSLVHKFSNVEKILNRGDNLYQWWGYYLRDLNIIFNCPSNKQSGISAKEFSDKYGNSLYNKIKSLYPFFDKKILRWEYNNYLTVAKMHNFTLSKDRVNKAKKKFSLFYTTAIDQTY